MRQQGRRCSWTKVVDYVGLTHELKAAPVTYTGYGGIGRTAIDQRRALKEMLENHEICFALFHGFDQSKWVTGSSQQRLSVRPGVLEHILRQKDGKDRLMLSAPDLSRAFAPVPHQAETLRSIAREPVPTVRADVTIDRTAREHVRAHLRVLVKRILRKHGYSPDKQEEATQTVLAQADAPSLPSPAACPGWW